MRWGRTIEQAPGTTDRVVPEGLDPPRAVGSPGVLGTLAAILVGIAAAWLAEVTTVPRPAIDWAIVNPPPGLLNPRSLTTTPAGFSVLSGPYQGGARLWSSADGVVWEATALSRAAARVVPAGDGLIAFNGAVALGLEREGGRWVEDHSFELPELLRIGYGSGRPGLVARSGGILAQAVTGDVYWSDDRLDFDLVIAEPAWGAEIGMPTDSECDPPESGSLDVPPVVVAAGTFVALVSRDSVDPFGVWPVCEPEVWSSADGRHWERATEGSPFGPGAFVYDLAWRDGLYLAVGGADFDDPAMWSSVDALAWERLEPLSAPMRHELRSVESGAAGWVVLGEAATGPGLLGWTSGDSRCWEPLPADVRAREAAVGDDRLLLVDRMGSSGLWLGTVNGDEITGECS